VAALEDLGGDRPHHRGQAIAERSLRDNHRVEQHRRRSAAKPDQAQVADDEAKIADHPDPFTPDAVGQMTERDLTWDSDKAH
jgi:hypothetical protein